MNLVKTNYYTLQELKTADPKLRKPIISNCKKRIGSLYKRVYLERSERIYKADRMLHVQTTKAQGGDSQGLRQSGASFRQKETYSPTRNIPAASIKCHSIYAR